MKFVLSRDVPAATLAQQAGRAPTPPPPPVPRRLKTLKALRLADGRMLGPGDTIPADVEARELVRHRQKGALFEALPPLRRIRVTQPMAWGTPGKMRTAQVGELLVTDPALARRLIAANRAEAAEPFDATGEAVTP